MVQLWACKDRVKNHIINNLSTSNVQSVQENIKPWPYHIDLAITRLIWQDLGLRFSNRHHSRLIRSYYYMACVCSTDWSA